MGLVQSMRQFPEAINWAPTTDRLKLELAREKPKKTQLAQAVTDTAM